MKSIMKRIISIVIVTVLLLSVSLLAACALASAENDLFKDVQPLPAPIELKISTIIGSEDGLIIYLIDKMGGFDKVGIKPKFMTFANGPIMNEAIPADAWDVATEGTGGVLSAVIGYGAYIVATSKTENFSMQIFAHIDSDIVRAGKNIKDSPELYGNAETWKGKEIYLPIGTSLHYTLAEGLGKFGLTDNDVKLTNMDVSTVNTLLRAGREQIIGGLWNVFTYETDLKDKFGYVPVMKASDVCGDMVCSLVVHPKSYNDPKKRVAIKKFVELFFKTMDWVNTGENKDIAAHFYTEWNDSVGAKSSYESNKIIVDNCKYFSLKESYDTFNKKSADGKMTVAEEFNYKPLMFFISKGKYKPQDAQKLLDGYFKSDIINELYTESQKK